MSLISKLILYIKVGAKSILKMAATPSHGSWSKRVISPLPESAEASPREGALLGKPTSESQKGKPVLLTVGLGSAAAASPVIIRNGDYGTPQSHLQSQNLSGGAQESSGMCSPGDSNAH